MSLLINGMEMPKCCCDCLLYDSAGFCALDPTREFEDYNHKRPDDCPLSEIPTPHGRLIDADDIDSVTVVCTDHGTIKRIDAPTVIEAEE